MLDKQTTAIKDQILRLSPKLNSLYKGLEAATRREDGLVISWAKSNIWLHREGHNRAALSSWQDPKDVVEVAKRLPKLLDALEQAKTQKEFEEQRRAGDLSAAQAALATVAERLRMPGTPQHPTEFEDDHIAL